MYSRQNADGRFSRGLRIPGNYSGNAFRTEPEEEQKNDFSDSDTSVSAVAEEIAPVASQDTHKADEALQTGLGRLLGRGGGIGFEELLILGLVLLVSQSDTRDDLAFLLLLLLFIQ